MIAFSPLLHHHSLLSPPTHSGFTSILLSAAAEALLGGELHRRLCRYCLFVCARVGAGLSSRPRRGASSKNGLAAFAHLMLQRSAHLGLALHWPLCWAETHLTNQLFFDPQRFQQHHLGVGPVSGGEGGTAGHLESFAWFTVTIILKNKVNLWQCSNTLSPKIKKNTLLKVNLRLENHVKSKTRSQNKVSSFT